MSLTESLVAGAVVSTVMAIALPSVNSARKTYMLRHAAHEVASGMQAARVSAITRNRDCRMSATSAVSYVVECEDTAWQVVERHTVPRGVTLEANARPEFHRRGNVSPTATFTLRSDAGTVRVIVNVNGRVRLQ